MNSIKRDFPGLRHHRRGLDQQLRLMVRIVGASVRHIVQNIVSVQFVSLGNGQKSFRPEGSLCVDVKAFAFSATLTHRKLKSREIL